MSFFLCCLVVCCWWKRGWKIVEGSTESKIVDLPFNFVATPIYRRRLTFYKRGGHATVDSKGCHRRDKGLGQKLVYPSCIELGVKRKDI